MDEPSLLDYLKAKFAFWKSNPYEIFLDEAQPPDEIYAQASIQPGQAPETTSSASILNEPGASSQEEIHLTEAEPVPLPGPFPWRSTAALILAFTGQFALSPGPNRGWEVGTVLLLVSSALLIWGSLKGELALASSPEPVAGIPVPALHLNRLLFGFVFAAGGFFGFSNLEFNPFNLALSTIGLWLVAWSFWEPRHPQQSRPSPASEGSWQPSARVSSKSAILWALLTLGMVGFFRFYRLAEVPPEMNSDHAEKILDVLRILEGKNYIFFAGNGGREALQFYLVAGLHHFFGLPLGFNILKIATVAVGFAALPFLYLLGKELGGKRVGLLAFTFAGIAYWPNVVARVGLRLPFYMFFSAAVLYFLLRGLRRRRINDCIVAGIFLGFSLYGYSADRILPFLVAGIVFIYVLHQRSNEKNLFSLAALLAAASVSLVVFVPLLRYITAEPQSFFMRMMTRVGSLEQPITQPPLKIFFDNNLKAFAMFSWDAGVVWPISIPGYPALSTISGGLFYLGLVLVLIRYLRTRTWSDLGLLLAIPILMLPSTLSIAFPGENPNLYRTGGAMVPVFLLIGLAADGWMAAVERAFPPLLGKRLALTGVLLLVWINAAQDYRLVFQDYFQNYQRSAWNSSEMGTAARLFIDTYQVPDNIWVVGYPNWVDTRLVAVNAGYPGRDYELKLENIGFTIEKTGPKLFIIKPEDNKALETLQSYYPTGWLEVIPSKIEGKDFLLFRVPAEGTLK